MITELYPNLQKYEIRENKGSMSYNRLAMQLSFAMWQLFELYKHSNFTISLDCIDDVVVFNTSEENPNITTYQLKTKDSNAGNFEIKALSGNNVFQKLYDHIEKIDEDVKEVILVSNLSLKFKKKIISGELITLNKIDEDIKTIIIEDLSKNPEFAIKGFTDKLKFSQIDMSIQNHLDISKNKFNQLLLNQKIDISLVTADALFNTLHLILHTKQSHEFSLQDDILTVLPKKSFSSHEFGQILENAKKVNELIKYKDIIEKYKYGKLNLREESHYKQALATFKDKVSSSPNIIMDIMKKITKYAGQRILNGCESRIELLVELTQEFNQEFEMYFSIMEKEILFINSIEQAIEGGS